MVELSYKILKKCRKYKRCRECEKVMPRGSEFGFSYCPFCVTLPSWTKKIREDFLKWYEREGKALENVLPNPMPKKAEIQKMLNKIRRGKKHD